MVARPIGQFTGNADYHYQTLRCNCDLLKIIQLVRAWAPCCCAAVLPCCRAGAQLLGVQPARALS